MRMRVLPSFLIPVCCGAFSAVAGACGFDGTSDAPVALSPMVPVDSIRLLETDAAHISRPSGIEQARNGDYLVSDRLSGQLYRFTHAGQFLNTIGRKGAGPGEFQAPRGIAIVNDTIIAFDPGLRRAQTFTLDGDLAGDPFALAFDLSMVASAGSSVWIGGSGGQDRMSLLRWNRTTGDVASLLPVPALLQSNPLLLLLGGAVFAPADGPTQSMIVGFGAGSTVYRVDPENGEILDSVVVPIRRRRGLPDEAIDRAREGDGFAVINAASGLTRIARLSSGGFALLHMDMTRKQVSFSGDMFLTTVSADGIPSCVDFPVPLLDETRPMVSVKGDTLIILEQPIDESDSVATIIRRFAIREVQRCG